jgi:hypothetical protein
MLKKIFTLILIAFVLYFDWTIMKELIADGDSPESRYMLLFGSVTLLAILLLYLDYQN